MLGWTVLSQLKHNPLTRHIPVQIITLDEDRQHGLARGAFSFIIKPTTPEGIADALSRIREFAKPRRKRLTGKPRDHRQRHRNLVGEGQQFVEALRGGSRVVVTPPERSNPPFLRPPVQLVRQIGPLRRRGRRPSKNSYHLPIR